MGVFNRKSLFRAVLALAVCLGLLSTPIFFSTLLAAEKGFDQPASQAIEVPNPAANLWRAVRERNQSIEGHTQVKSIKAGTLIDVKGDEWRKFRIKWLIPYGGYFILGVPGVLLLLLIIVRKVKIPEGRSGKRISRMTTMQRVSHWFLVTLVSFMALTGLIILFGRFVLIPYISASTFSPLASASKEGHNLFGPLLVVALIMMLVYFIRYNWPARVDFKWLITLGGLLSKKHLKIGFFNAGEKLLYWAVITLGVILSVTGLLLLFPVFNQTSNWMQVAIAVHAIAALLLIAAAFAHIWMVITMEGTLDAMTKGDVDENWAKAHHSLWYEQAKNVINDRSSSQTTKQRTQVPEKSEQPSVT